MRWIPFVIFLLIAIQWYALSGTKDLTQNKLWWILYGLIVTLVLGSFLWQIFNYDRSVGWTQASPTLSVGLLL